MPNGGQIAVKSSKKPVDEHPPVIGVVYLAGGYFLIIFPPYQARIQ